MLFWFSLLAFILLIVGVTVAVLSSRTVPPAVLGGSLLALGVFLTWLSAGETLEAQLFQGVFLLVALLGFLLFCTTLRQSDGAEATQDEGSP